MDERGSPESRTVWEFGGGGLNVKLIQSDCENRISNFTCVIGQIRRRIWCNLFIYFFVETVFPLQT